MRHLSGMDMVLDGIIFRREPESVIADRENYIITVHPLFSRDDIHRRERARMPDMEPGTGGIRELNQTIEFRLIQPGNGSIGF